MEVTGKSLALYRLYHELPVQRKFAFVALYALYINFAVRVRSYSVGSYWSCLFN
jgi:hypothetical protein